MKRRSAEALLLLAAVQIVGCATQDTRHSFAVLKPHDGDRLWVFPEHEDHLGTGGELQIFVDSSSHPKAKASFAKYTMNPGGALPIHRHEKTEEFTYFTSGSGAVVSVDAAGKEVETPVSAGYVWYIPPGVWHAVRNTGAAPLSMVFATIPNEKKGLLSFFRRVSVGPGKKGRQFSEEELHRIGREHDLIFRASGAHGG